MTPFWSGPTSSATTTVPVAKETEARLGAGEDLVLVIDVQGAGQVQKRLPGTVTVFMLPPSFQVLEQRLRKRSKDPEPEMQRRLATAKREVDAVSRYDYVVVNDLLERCVGELAGIVVAERARLALRREKIRPIVATFHESVPGADPEADLDRPDGDRPDSTEAG